MCINDDGTSMQWQIQLGSVEVAPTQLVHLATIGRPRLHEFINATFFGALRTPIYASCGPPNPKGLATPMEKGYCHV